MVFESFVLEPHAAFYHSLVTLVVQSKRDPNCKRGPSWKMREIQQLHELLPMTSGCFSGTADGAIIRPCYILLPEHATQDFFQFKNRRRKITFSSKDSLLSADCVFVFDFSPDDLTVRAINIDAM